MEETIKIDKEELKEAIDRIDGNPYGEVRPETLEKLMERYYAKKCPGDTGYKIIALITQCMNSFDFNLHYGYNLAACSFVGKHGGKPKLTEAKEVSKMLAKDREEKEKDTNSRQNRLALKS